MIENGTDPKSSAFRSEDRSEYDKTKNVISENKQTNSEA
jgi:hypothetical protein